MFTKKSLKIYLAILFLSPLYSCFQVLFLSPYISKLIALKHHQAYFGCDTGIIPQIFIFPAILWTISIWISCLIHFYKNVKHLSLQIQVLLIFAFFIIPSIMIDLIVTYGIINTIYVYLTC